jgi:hypothetical protein
MKMDQPSKNSFFIKKFHPKNRFFSPTQSRAVRRFVPMMWIDQVKPSSFFFNVFIYLFSFRRLH